MTVPDDQIGVRQISAVGEEFREFHGGCDGWTVLLQFIMDLRKHQSRGRSALIRGKLVYDLLERRARFDIVAVDVACQGALEEGFGLRVVSHAEDRCLGRQSDGRKHRDTESESDESESQGRNPSFRMDDDCCAGVGAESKWLVKRRRKRSRQI